MKQLKAELDEEAKDRRMQEIKQNIISGGMDKDLYRKSTAFEDIDMEQQHEEGGSGCSSSSNNNNRKIRSKSVTFLDEISNSGSVDGDSSRQSSNLVPNRFV